MPSGSESVCKGIGESQRHHFELGVSRVRGMECRRTTATWFWVSVPVLSLQSKERRKGEGEGQQVGLRFERVRECFEPEPLKTHPGSAALNAPCISEAPSYSRADGFGARQHLPDPLIRPTAQTHI